LSKLEDELRPVGLKQEKNSNLRSKLGRNYCLQVQNKGKTVNKKQARQKLLLASSEQGKNSK